MPRKQSLADKLTPPVPQPQPGWRDTIKSTQMESEPDSVTPPEVLNPLVRKTYLLTPELISRIEQLSNERQVRVNELVRYLLLTALELAENDQIEIPTQPGKRTISL